MDESKIIKLDARARPLDGHINRNMGGLTLANPGVLKDGTFLVLETTKGERYYIAWVNPETGEAIPGEPALVRVDVNVKVEGVSIFGAANNV